MSLQQKEIGPEAPRPRRPRDRVGQGTRKVPRQCPLILRISNRRHFSAVPCLSPISVTAGIARHRRAKPSRVVVKRRRRATKRQSENLLPRFERFPLYSRSQSPPELQS